MSGFKLPEKKTIQEMENATIKFWKKNKIFEKSVEQRPEDNLYVFYDGPPFISGLPHYGHLLGSIAKDLIPRYWTMKGKRVERVWGWDAHGLTVENRVQERLDIKNRKDIEKFGLEKFTEACYEYTSEVSAEWNWYVDKIARWVDMENAYKTIDRSYMESVLWAFKQMYDKKLIYEGVYTSLYCTTCGTPVSDFEIAMDNTYKEFEDPSITVKFPIKSKGKYGGIKVLAWTTTPWTIPSNRGLVVDENADYVVVEYNGDKFIVAKERLEKVFKDKKYTVQKKFKGTDLIGLDYEPPYTFYEPNEKDFKIYSYEGMVHFEEGTGIVHSAPGFGMIDTDMGRHHGLTIMLTIDDEGKFVPGNAGKNPFEGVFYAEANNEIRKDLNERDILFEDKTVVHRVPYHDRCDTNLIQRAQSSWFVDIQAIKQDMLKNNEDINWVPDHLKYGMFKTVIETAPDWCISRSRFWATPMPVWESEDGDRIVLGSVKEIEKLSGQKITDLHRPYIDDITIEKDGIKYKRIPEVLDSWFEAGSMPYAQIHYPFENQEKFEKNFPGDYVVEYIAQVRAWFSQMHRLSTALFNTAPFKNAVSTGVMSGSDGRKMSKTYGNYTDPKEVLETIGGDALRLYLMNSPLMLGANANFDDETLRTKLRRVVNPLWNSAKFFLIYGKQHDWRPNKSSKSTDVEDVLNKWILVRLHQTIKDISENLDSYLVPPAVQVVEDFVDDLSRWYVRRSRERIFEGDMESLSVLYTVLVDFSKAAAPVIPFITEKIYQELVVSIDSSVPESVHLCDFPEFDQEFINENEDLVANMASDRIVVSPSHAVRGSEGVPARQPLRSLASVNPIHYEEIIKDEVNVKEILQNVDLKEFEGNSDYVVDKADGVALSVKNIPEELQAEGNAREMIRKIQNLRKKNGLTVGEEIEVVYKDTEDNKKSVELFSDQIKRKVQARSLRPGKEFSIKKL